MSTFQLRLCPADHGRAISMREFRDAEAEEGYRHELTRGVVEATEAPGPALRRVVVLDRSEADWREHVAKADDLIPGLVPPGPNARGSELWAGVTPDADA